MKAVRASVASRVQEEHESLKETMASIKAEITKGPDTSTFSDWKLQFVWRLRDFQNALLKHFDLEEDGGFMTDLVAISPGCASRVAILKQEHEDIVPRLNELTEELKGITSNQSSSVKRVTKRILDLFEMLERHEAAERELIQDVYFQDIGVGD